MILIRRRWLPVVALVALLVAVVASAPGIGTADNDPDFDARSGDRLRPRQVIIKDAFNLNRGQSTELNGRLPEPFNNGNRWAVDSGTWQVGRAFVSEVGSATWFEADRRANVDSGLANVLVTATILRDRRADDPPYGPGGPDYAAITQFSGVTARFVSGVDWVGAWYDPFGWPADPSSPSQTCPRGQERCGAVVLGAKNLGDPSCPGGNNYCSFAELARYRFEWGDGKKHRLGLAVVDDQVTALLNGRGIISREFGQLSDATFVGIFSRGPGDNRFEEFEATGRIRIKTNVTPVKDDRGNNGVRANDDDGNDDGRSPRAKNKDD